MAYQFIQYKKQDHITYITIDRPKQLNALHPPANFEMRKAFNHFKNDTDAWVAILTGTGNKSFSSGNDLGYHAIHGVPGEPYPEADVHPFGGITSDFTCWKPIIAAINGYALGGGLELALTCDIIVAADHAKLGLPEPRVGLVASAGATNRLPKQIPYKIAMGMLLTGKQIRAQEAYQWGLVNEVVSYEDLIPNAEWWAEEILKCAPLAVRATKQMATISQDLPLDESVKLRHSEYEKAMDSQDFLRGPKAFIEKRSIKWEGI